MGAMLDVQNLSVHYGAATVLQGASFTLKPGQWLMVAGPNGAGKSSLVGAIAQSVRYTGKALFNGQDIARMKAARRARCLGMLMQSHHVGYAFTVAEVVRLGRYSYAGGLLKPAAPADEQAVERALRDTGLWQQRNRSVLTLSGGELQRTFLAQLLAQQPSLLLLDEPANHLDLPYQKQVFGLIQDWLRDGERAVLSVVHDLSLAKAYGTHALLLDKGHVMAHGEVDEVLDDGHLAYVYGMDVGEWMRELLGRWQG